MPFFSIASNTFAFSFSNTIELPLVYFWRGKAQWALVRIHSACQNHPTAFSCILHLCLSRPLEWDNTMGIFCLTQRKRKFKHKLYSKCVSFPEVKISLFFSSSFEETFKKHKQIMAYSNYPIGYLI